jgi:hypothetical protein
MYTVSQQALVLAVVLVLAVACSLSAPHHKRHLDRRRRICRCSGEIPVFRLCSCSCFFVAFALLLLLSLLMRWPGLVAQCFSFGSPGHQEPPRSGLHLPKAGVQPEGRNDPSIAIALVLALAVARSRCKLPKTQKNACQTPKSSNPMKTNQIEFAY